MPPRSSSLLAAAVALTAAAWPAAASAQTLVTATVTYDASGALVVTAGAMAKHPSVQASDDGRITVLDNGDGSVAADDPRWESGGEYLPYMVHCERPTSIRVVLGDGDDDFSLSGDFGVPITVDGEGDDVRGVERLAVNIPGTWRRGRRPEVAAPH